jgi:hypothetical protein
MLKFNQLGFGFSNLKAFNNKTLIYKALGWRLF